ncbi:sulfatase-like hydrolase/transferase [Schaedlerella arabinosiphila]|uniref:Sulfatase-like hydrolase/transferase n=1 Tax=Schaedlerella arabinosiphila TaxID=2044587 RepID=A0A9X5CCG6_9FIRM|nr:sulfatase-like hydrolase/transferase [Schaedlerella arabinosiphila]
MEIQENLIGSAKTEESEYLNSQGKAAENAGEVPFRLFSSSRGQRQPSVDMNQVVGKMDILLVCLDTLRYDVAAKEEAQGTTPVLNRYGFWKKCQAPGNFTWPSHHAMFAGFLPADCGAKNLADREMLFFPKQISMGKKAPRGAYGFSGGTIMEGLEKEGYDTWCVGGVSFFDKRSDLGKVFPGYFRKSYWNPSFGCGVKDSTKNQVDFILKKLDGADPEQNIFMYLNVDAIHYPNYFYLEGSSYDTAASHGAALRYVDGELGRLFDRWKEKRGETFVICCSDHGTCYGEDGCQFHGINHPIVNTVPYKHFFL